MRRLIFLRASIALFLSVGLASAQTAAPLTEWSLPNANFRPTGITVDSFGMVYFLEGAFFPFGGRIGRLDPATNTLTEWQVPSPGNFAFSRIFAAADGQIFYANSGSFSSVTRFDPATSVLTRWPANRFFDVNDLGVDTSDPENPLVWVVGIGSTFPRLDLAKNEYEVFNVRPAGVGFQIEVDADGVVWSTSQAAALLRFDPKSGQRIIYADCQIGPGCASGQLALKGALAIRLDEDGKVVVSETGLGPLPGPSKIGIFDPAASVITEYAVPTPDSRVNSLAVADTGIFFAEADGNKVARLDPTVATGTDTELFADVATITSRLVPQAPVFSSLTPVDSQLTPTVTDVTSSVTNGFEEFAVPTDMSSPQGIVVAGCSVFFTESLGQKVGRLKIPPESPLRKLKHKVGRMAGKFALSEAQARSLNEKLEEASYFFAFQNAGGAAVVLRSFMDEVSELIQAGAVPPSEGHALLTATGNIVHFCN